MHPLSCLFSVSDVGKSVLKENPNCSAVLFCDIVIFGVDKR